MKNVVKNSEQYQKKLQNFSVTLILFAFERLRKFFFHLLFAEQYQSPHCINLGSNVDFLMIGTDYNGNVSCYNLYCAFNRSNFNNTQSHPYVLTLLFVSCDDILCNTKYDYQQNLSNSCGSSTYLITFWFIL